METEKRYWPGVSAAPGPAATPAGLVGLSEAAEAAVPPPELLTERPVDRGPATPVLFGVGSCFVPALAVALFLAGANGGASGGRYRRGE